MAFAGKTISNPKTGQEIKFLRTAMETGGDLLEMESVYHSYSKEPVPHYHPQQAEDFEVVAGELSVRMEGKVRILKAGEKLHIPINTVHSMWNAQEGKTVVNWKIKPALKTDHMLENFCGLAMDGKTNEKGVPGILQVALLANKFSNEFRVAKPPYWVQKLLFAILTPFALLSGKKSGYSKYID